MFYRVKFLPNLDYSFRALRYDGDGNAEMSLFNHDMSQTLLKLIYAYSENIIKIYVYSIDSSAAPVDVPTVNLQNGKILIRFSKDTVVISADGFTKTFQIDWDGIKDISYAKILNLECPEHLLLIGIEGGGSGFDIASLEYTILSSRVEVLETLVAQLIKTK